MVNKKFILGFLVVLSIFIFSCTNQDDVDYNGMITETPNISSIDNDIVIDDLNNIDSGVVDSDNDLDDDSDNGVINDDVDNDLINDDVVGEVKSFYVESGDTFEFFVDGESNADMVVNVGDTVRVEFKSSDRMPHDWRVDEFSNAASAILSNGESEVIEFVADRPGTFEYYCSVGLHREYGMYGRFIVEE